MSTLTPHVIVPPPIQGRDRSFQQLFLPVGILLLVLGGVFGCYIWLKSRTSSDAVMQAEVGNLNEASILDESSWTWSLEDYYQESKDRWNHPLEFPKDLGIPEE